MVNLSMTTDYKDWVTERVEELAQERYNKTYDELPDSIQEEILNRAEADWIDNYAARIDAAYEAECERLMFS